MSRLLSLRSASRQPPIRAPAAPAPPLVHEPEQASLDMRVASVESEVSHVKRRVERLKSERPLHAQRELYRLIDERIGIRAELDFMAAQRHRKGMLDAVGMLVLTLFALGLLYKVVFETRA